MTKEQVNKMLEKYKDYFLTYDFLEEIEKYYDVVQITENVYFITEMDLEIEIRD
jgi:hypothetical protein